VKILIINGPNLARLDLRDADIYGGFSYPQLSELVMSAAEKLKISVDIRQSDSESEIIQWLHEAADNKQPLIINPAAFTHYSYAIRDAVSMLKAPSIEVHLSNPLSREEFRHTSVVSGVVNGTIAGFGVQSYILALHAMQNLLN
jgi:3-dehydroquinate dehydratase-2